MPPNPNDTTGFALDMTGMGKGMAFVNGYPIGRYWMIEVINYFFLLCYIFSFSKHEMG
jgi:hypothetical protein